MKRLAAVALFLSASFALAVPSGHKWFPANIPVKYKVFAHTSIKGMAANTFTAQVLPRVQEAFTNWTSTRVACTSWRSTYDGTFSAPADHTAQNGNDSINHVIWLGGTEWRYSSTTLGLTTTLYFPNTGEIIDADMELNNNVSWSNTQSASTFDYESVVLHEAGHFAGLDHTTNVSASVMFPTVSMGVAKRTLTTTDVNDICGVYPSGGMGMGAQGSPCTAQTQCVTGLVCRTKAGSTTGKICTVDCTSNAMACTSVAPLTCQNADTGKACLQPTASADYCKFCVDGASCTAGNCLTDGFGHNWCTNPCSTSAPCPSGSSCLDVATAGSCGTGSASCICAPTPNSQGAVFCPGQCNGSTCGTTPGFGCNNTTCEATGNEGDRCELSGHCKSCLICIGTSSAANCRKCCGGMGQTGACKACPNATCVSGEACQPVNQTTDSICYPQGGADLCMACGVGTTCLNGNTCIGGKCHVSCNPQAPGSCTACQPTGSNTGLCACPGEERNEGESCGGSGVAACRTGLVCSGGTCKRTCVVGNTSSCPAGQVCQSVSGTAVCVADTAGARCAACSGLTCAPGASCYQGRCYTTCNTAVKNGPCDATCVDVGNGVNLCACDDQVRGAGQTCGANPIAACGDRLYCLGGVCAGECTLSNPSSCPILTECKLLSGTSSTYVCQPIDNPGTGGGSGSNPDDCTSTGTCATGKTCISNNDGTATCRSNSELCDPNADVNPCSTGQVCRSVDGMPARFTCQDPLVMPNNGCGCTGGPGELLVLALGAWLARRRAWVRRTR
ncbi:MAG: matrixin family metalloprotease [Archangiaceae bacterium]|nr:matrixin family metalloprotease [Archangiaceae bacterium]